MNAIVTADWHLYDMPGFPGHINQICAAVTYAAKKGRENGATEFFVLGDIFHNPRPTNKERRVYAELLSLLNALDYRVFLLPGNHDISPRETSDKHSALAETSILSPRGVTVCSFGSVLLLGDTKILCLPHSNEAVEKGLTAQALNAVKAAAAVYPNAKNKMIMGHNPIPDALPIMLDPADPDNVRRCLTPEFINAPEVQEYNLIYLGDIHVHKSFLVGNKTVSYPGSTIRTRFDEIHHEKWADHLTDKNGIEVRSYRIENNYEMVDLIFAPETGLLVKHSGMADKTIKCSIKDLPSTLEAMENLKDKIVKLTYSGPGKDLALLSATELAEIIMRKNPAHIFKITGINTDTSTARDLKFSSALSPKEAFIEWKGQQNYSDAELSGRVEKAGLELLNGLN